MKSDKILNAIGMINEEAVADAGTCQRPRARRWVRLCAAAAAVLLLSTTAMAATWMFLHPAQVTEQVGDHTLTAAFEGEDVISINQSATSGGYTFTLLAMVSGEGLSDYFRTGANVQPERTYAVLAIQHADGAPMTWDDYDIANFLVTPLLQGEKPWQFNVATLGGNASVILEDGVVYCLVEFNDIMAFADREVYLGVCSGIVPSPDTFLMDEATGKISANPDDPNFNVVFTLPIDPSYADPARAQAYLAEIYGLLGLNPDGSVPEDVPSGQDGTRNEPQAEPSLALTWDIQGDPDAVWTVFEPAN